jgi:hypothetical protein
MNPPIPLHPCVRALITLAATMLGVGVTTATLAAAVALLGGCGGDADASPTAGETQVAVLDIDALGSIDAAAQEAAAARGAPGEAEPVQLVVQARDLPHATRAAAELERLGFSRVRVADAHDGLAAR